MGAALAEGARILDLIASPRSALPMNEIEKLTTAQLRLLRWLHDAGGVGFLDQC